MLSNQRPPLYPQLFHARAQRARIDAENFGGAFFSVDYPARFVEGARNVMTLDVLERLDGRDIRPVLGPKHRLVDLHNWAARQHDGALDDVLQFAHVAGPAIVL